MASTELTPLRQLDVSIHRLPDESLTVTAPVHKKTDTVRSKRVTVLSLTALSVLSLACFALLSSPSADSPITSPLTSSAARNNAIGLLSTATPESIGMGTTTRPPNTKPFAVWNDFPTPVKPTNDWWENLAFGVDGHTDGSTVNFVYTLPYHIDVADLDHRGIRVANTNVSTRSVMNRYCQVIDCAKDPKEDFMLDPHLATVATFNMSQSVSLSSTLPLAAPVLTSGSKLAVELTWRSTNDTVSSMKAPLVYGMPYATMEHYANSRPLITFDQHLHHGTFSVDGETLLCDGTTFTARHELLFTLKPSEETWVVFTSAPLRMVCDRGTGQTMIQTVSTDSSYLSDSDASPSVVVRLALVSNSTSDDANSDAMLSLLRAHAGLYPSKDAFVDYEVVDDTGFLTLDWQPKQLSRHWTSSEDDKSDALLLMWAMPHHTRDMKQFPGFATLSRHRRATVRGVLSLSTASQGVWTLELPLEPLQFTPPGAIQSIFLDSLNDALDTDRSYELPREVQLAAGTTYDGGKMLAKLARLALIAEELGRQADAANIAHRLASTLNVWLSSSALSPLLYDLEWGGVVACGCYFDPKTETCGNQVGPDCPALSDLGQNFGHGFYQDHHFHFGYLIYAAATVARFLPRTGRDQFDRVSLLIRDIANPTTEDPLFPVWRHKDWYLGLSWASGITKHEWGPDPHGRNQESVSEAVNAYDAVAIYGQTMVEAFDLVGNKDKAMASRRIRDSGRLMLATELQGARSYWQVCEEDCDRANPRTYPESFRTKVVGQVWTTTAETQTWFGPEPWKVAGIQLIPETAVSQSLWSPDWVAQMLPEFSHTCERDTFNCVDQGWSTLSWGAAAVLGGCRIARDHILGLPDSIYSTPGGNGQSKTNALWWAAKQCDTSVDDY